MTKKRLKKELKLMMLMSLKMPKKPLLNSRAMLMPLLTKKKRKKEMPSNETEEIIFVNEILRLSAICLTKNLKFGIHF